MTHPDPHPCDPTAPPALGVTAAEHEQLLGQRAMLVWFTGLSGAGKSSIATALELRLHDLGVHTVMLDGDQLRQGLNRDLGFEVRDRVENIRRVAEVARLMLDAGLVVLSSFISPFRADRHMARELIGSHRFLEVFVDAPLSLCEQRDPKGLYKKARAGLLPNFTGIGQAYEAPTAPACHLLIRGDTDLNASVHTLLDLLLQADSRFCIRPQSGQCV
jgi:bifunctional enzyme CysN/CysC